MNVVSCFAASWSLATPTSRSKKRRTRNPCPPSDPWRHSCDITLDANQLWCQSHDGHLKTRKFWNVKPKEVLRRQCSWKWTTVLLQSTVTYTERSERKCCVLLKSSFARYSVCDVMTFRIENKAKIGPQPALVIALRPQTPKHIRGGWSHYTDTSKPVDDNGAQNMVTVRFP
jgi:hypothetical protein